MGSEAKVFGQRSKRGPNRFSREGTTYRILLENPPIGGGKKLHGGTAGLHGTKLSPDARESPETLEKEKKSGSVVSHLSVLFILKDTAP